MRLVLLLPAGVALLAGLDAALTLLGLPAPVRLDRLPVVHGPLMVLGFVGTLVALERAVALAPRTAGERSRPWAWASPGLLGLGGLLLVAPAPLVVGQLCQVGGAGVLVALYGAAWGRRADAAIAVQGLGAVAAVGAAALWAAGVPVPALAPWLVAFLVLTIAGERLELMRITPVPAAAERGLVAASLGLVSGAALTLLWPGLGTAVLGASLVGLVAVLGRFDVARRTVRGHGLPRFMAVAMLASFAWLAVAGGIWLLGGPATGGVRYDAVLHAVFLGFVMSMVMAHAPVILPAVLRRPLPYRPVMYVPLALLHSTLVLRVLVGDARDVAWAVQVGGVGNIVAVLTFVAVAATSVLRGAPPTVRPVRSRTEPAPTVAVVA
ncbi:hypothetical protein [Cellulomonas gilvus]|uniref:NnrS family protein n=1 Tax=Cellulomonas gilvus (strain ATCC 13127 / NRRL B-14078) TaxID=593907 RepID=F8A0Z1_CELGA|nr:hypothetical protein [Cellulomonas gilvus]AEI12749.1 hypothetical protein Celgi_2249 [Cellulomonas gilvus ATCC 13127]